MMPSPLPPEPVPTLETLDGKLSHAIVVLEITNGRVARWDERFDEFRLRQGALERLAERLSGAALRVSAARIAVGVIPATRWLTIALVAAVSGGTGAMLYEMARATAALAAGK